MNEICPNSQYQSESHKNMLAEPDDYFHLIRSQLLNRFNDYRTRNPVEFINLGIDIHNTNIANYPTFTLISTTTSEVLFRMDKPSPTREPAFAIFTKSGQWVSLRFQRYNYIRNKYHFKGSCVTINYEPKKRFFDPKIYKVLRSVFDFEFTYISLDSTLEIYLYFNGNNKRTLC